MAGGLAKREGSDMGSDVRDPEIREGGRGHTGSSSSRPEPERADEARDMGTDGRGEGGGLQGQGPRVF